MFPLFFVLAALSLWASVKVYRRAADAPEPLRFTFAVSVFLGLAFCAFLLSAVLFGKNESKLSPQELTEQEKIIQSHSARPGV